MSNIYRECGSTLPYFQVTDRDWTLLKDCSLAAIKLYLAYAARTQKQSSPHITWTTEDQMKEANLVKRSVVTARQELSEKGIVTISEVAGRKGLWQFSVSVPNKRLDLNTITTSEALAYYSRYLPDAVETDCLLQSDCPLHTKATGINKYSNGDNKVQAKGDNTFNVELRPSTTGVIGTWWCFCYGSYAFGQTVEFERRKHRITTAKAHNQVTDFFLALREQQQEQKYAPRQPYRPNREEQVRQNVISETI